MLFQTPMSGSTSAGDIFVPVYQPSRQMGNGLFQIYQSESKRQGIS